MHRWIRLRSQLAAPAVAAGLVIVLAAAAGVLAIAQSRARDGLTDRLHERNATMARFVRSTYVQSFGSSAQTIKAALRNRTPAQALAYYAGDLGDDGSRFVMLDRSGAVLASLPGSSGAFERSLARAPFVAAARRSGWAISGVVPVGRESAFAVAVHVRTAREDVVLVDIGPLEVLQTFFKPLLAATPGVRGGQGYLVDDTGRAVSATVGRLGMPVPDGDLLRAAADSSDGRFEGRDGTVRFDVAEVPNTTQRVVVTAPESVLLAAASGTARWLPWLLLAALAGLGGATVLLVRRLTRQTDELVTVSAAKTEFLAEASHELRTPLNAIIGFSQLLHDGRLGEVDEVQRDALADVLSSSEHLLDVVSGLLDVTRVETGEIELHPQPLHLEQALIGVRAGLGALAGTQLVAIDIDVDPELPEMVMLDPTRLRQILLNYVSNALKHSAPGDRVQVRAYRDGAFLRLEVQDHGRGISAEDIDRLFTRYGRLAGSPDGTGLGLVVTRHIVEAHGGTVGVVSQPGEGATFWASLPLVPAAAEALAEPRLQRR